MHSEKVLILGATGFLGANLALSAPSRLNVLIQTRKAVMGGGQQEHFVSELTDCGALWHLLDRAAPTVVVNCSALANVDRCEREPDLADALNRAMPRSLAIACHERSAMLIHISTDAVFGATDGPYRAEDPVSPVNEYGRSKAAGEVEVLEHHPTAIVARTNIYGWSPTGDRSLLEFFHKRLSSGAQTPGFTDVMFRPISVLDMWPLLISWLDETRRTGIGGIRHATGLNLISKYEFGRSVATRFGFDPHLIRPASVNDVGLKAPRSPNLDVLPTLIAGEASDVACPGSLDESLDRLGSAERDGIRRRLSQFISAQEGVRA